MQNARRVCLPFDALLPRRKGGGQNASSCFHENKHPVSNFRKCFYFFFPKFSSIPFLVSLSLNVSFRRNFSFLLKAFLSSSGSPKQTDENVAEHHIHHILLFSVRESQVVARSRTFVILSVDFRCSYLRV